MRWIEDRRIDAVVILDGIFAMLFVTSCIVNDFYVDGKGMRGVKLVSREMEKRWKRLTVGF